MLPLLCLQVFSHREESARQLEESEDPKTPEASPNKSGEWRESDSGMEWVINSGKKDSTAKKNSLSARNGDDGGGGKDLDDEETFTNGECRVSYPFLEWGRGPWNWEN